MSTTSPIKSTNVRSQVSAISHRKGTNVRSLGTGALRASLAGLAHVAPPAAVHLAARLFSSPQRHRIHPSEHEAVLGAEPVELDRGRRVLRGHIWGSQHRATVLLVHGWSGRASQLSSFAAPLVAQGFRVVGFDLAAHGRSDGSRANIVTLAEDVLAIGDRFGSFDAVIAHSFGGPVTTLAVLTGLRSRRLAYVASPIDALEWLDRFSRWIGFDDAMQARLRDRLERYVGLGFEELDGHHIAPHMRVPLLVVHDEQDREVPFSAGATLASAWPGAELIKTAGLGHQRILRDRAVVDAVVRFVSAPTS